MQYRGLQLDEFQAEAIEALQQGQSVLVCAPTGTGKTIVADWLIDQALQQGRRVVYTAPIKALSNQKYRDWVRLHGEDVIGLITGDLVIRRDAPCLVMTTEILRNMLLSGDAPSDLAGVVLDEVHFLDDKDRGTVWEEVLIYLPKNVPVVGLSATLANLSEFSEWLNLVRGAPVKVVVETRRAVPLDLRAFTGTGGLLPMTSLESAWKRQRPAGPSERRGRRPRLENGHLDVFRTLERQSLLPYLYFVFSRALTESYARQLGRIVGDGLLPPKARLEVQRRVDEVRALAGRSLDGELERLYLQGIAYHHAGLHVQLKALVEGLYEDKLIRVLYCTSTFALGVNMPTRSVVFDSLLRFDGSSLNPMTTREFMQMAGRAGRRGLDEAGTVVVRVDLTEYPRLRDDLERVRKGRYEPVRSSFNLSWNSIVNLLDRHGGEPARIRQLLDSSFLAFRMAKRHAQQATARTAPDRVWNTFQDRVEWLTDIGYLKPDGSFGAGARVLKHLQMAEILMSELILAGHLEDLDPDWLFGVLCSLVDELPRQARRLGRVDPFERHLAKLLKAVRYSDRVVEADEMSGTSTPFDPDLIGIGQAWASGRTLDEVLAHLDNPTDLAGDLVSCFRRAKDLATQLVQVYRGDPQRSQELRDLVQRVTRDEVEVLD